ncbi:MAG: lysozyme [Pseudomonadota bacterium]
MNLEPALELIKEFEGLRLMAYLDPVGIPTIGYGSTKGVVLGQRITHDRAVELLLDDCKMRVKHLVTKIKVPVNDHELCAVLSLVYNIGLVGFDNSTLLRKLNAGEHKVDVADEFLRWKRAGGKVLPGLVRRRKAERKLFLTPMTLPMSLA